MTYIIKTTISAVTFTLVFSLFAVAPAVVSAQYDYGDSYAYDYGDSYPNDYGDSYAYDYGDSYDYDYGDSYAYDYGDSYPNDYGDSYAYDYGDSYDYDYGDSYTYDYYYDDYTYDYYYDDYTYDYYYDDYTYDYTYNYSDTVVSRPRSGESKSSGSVFSYSDSSVFNYTENTDNSIAYTDNSSTDNSFTYTDNSSNDVSYTDNSNFTYNERSHNHEDNDDDDDDNSSNSKTPRCDLDVSDTRIDEGDRITLSWEVENADEVRLTDDHGDELLDLDNLDDDEDHDGKIRVYPTRDTEYTLTVENGNKDRDCEVTVRVDEDDEKVVTYEVRDYQPTSGIYMKQVPYTGFDDSPVLYSIFYGIVGLWALYLAYYLTIRRKQKEVITLK